MKFSILIAIVSEDIEESVRESAKKAGAGGVTILNGKGSGLEEQKTFFGLTYEGMQSILIYIVEKSVSIKVLKAIKREIESNQEGSGLAFSMPIEHLGGIAQDEIENFEKKLKEQI